MWNENKDDDHEYSLEFCGSEIKNWKKWYCRKNSKNKVSIITRICFEANEQIFWRRYLELHINGKMKYQTRIRPEAYDTLTRDDKLPKTNYPGIEFTTLFTFTPNNINQKP